MSSPDFPPAVQSGIRLRSIDALRGAAALAVVVHHAVNAGIAPPATATWYPALSDLADYGRMGVPLFFVLSGFCIHFRWAQRRARGEDARIAFLPFWRRRLWRLYPPYLVALVFSMAIVLAAYFTHPNVPLLAGYPTPKLPWIGGDFLAHVLMLHGLIPAFDRAGGNAPFWTLAREEYFYLMYFGLLAFRERFGPFKAMAGVVVLGLLFPLAFRPFLAPDSAWWGVINSSSITLWAQWCLGLLGVEAFHGLIILPGFTRDLRLVPLWVGLGVWTNHFAPVALAPLAWGMAFFTLVNAVVTRERARGWNPGRLTGWLAQVGVYSYSIYLIHHPVRGLVKRVLERWIVSGNLLSFIAANAVVVIAGYYAGRLFFILVERRFINHKA